MAVRYGLGILISEKSSMLDLLDWVTLDQQDLVRYMNCPCVIHLLCMTVCLFYIASGIEPCGGRRCLGNDTTIFLSSAFHIACCCL